MMSAELAPCGLLINLHKNLQLVEEPAEPSSLDLIQRAMTIWVKARNSP
jgi:hypothetical protein